MLSLSATQKQFAYSANPKQITLVRIETYTDYAAKTVDETLYYATVPFRYRWDGSNVVAFRGFLESVQPLKRGFEHIPNGDILSTRDGLTVRFQTGEVADLNVWNLLRTTNLIGAKIEVATLLIDWGDETDARWMDQSTLAKDHIVRFRGEITQVPQYRVDATTFDLVADSIEPILDTPQALDASEVSQKDLGMLYPVPVGTVKRIPLVQRTVGWVTTLGFDISASFTGNVTVTDTTGFPDSGSFAFWIGAERLIGSKIGSKTINISARFVTIGAVTSIAVAHNAGAVMIEEILTANFVYSGIESLGVDALYCRSPQSGELVFIPTGLYGTVQADDVIDAGQPLGVVSFTQELMGGVIQLLNNAAAITVQPTASSSGVETLLIKFGGLEQVGNVVGSIDCDVRQPFDDGGGIVMDIDDFLDPKNAAKFTQPAGSVPNTSRVVSRFRPIFDYRIEANTNNATRMYYELSAMGQTQNKTQLENYNPGTPTQKFVTKAGVWETPAGGTTLLSLEGAQCFVYMDNSLGGTGSQTELTVYSTSRWEVELVPLTIAVTTTETTGAQEIGFNLDLFADVRGAIRIVSTASHTDMDNTTGWTPTGCTLSNQNPGLQLASDSTLIDRTAVKAVSNLDVNSHRFSFEYFVSTATWDIMSDGAEALRIAFTSAGGDSISWRWPKSCLHKDAWNVFSFDSNGTGTQIIAVVGTLDQSAVTQINIGWHAKSAAEGGQFSIRNMTTTLRTYITHPIDVAEWLIEDNAGLASGADSSSFATAKANLPNVQIGGDLRNAGTTFAEVLGRIGYECRTNFVATEGASASVYKALNALATYAFTAVSKTIEEYDDLTVVSRQLDDQPTEFMAVYDFRNDLDAFDLTGYRALLRADATQNDISAEVPTVDLTDAQALRGIRPTAPMPFYLLPDSASAIEVWAYYVAEALRATSLRFRMRVGFRYSYDLEPGDIVDFVPPWQVGAIKCRVSSITRPYDEPTATLELVEVE